MIRFVRFIFISVLNFVSLALLSLIAVVLLLIFNFITRSDYASLVQYDYSAIWVYQAQVVRPLGIATFCVYGLWLVFLLLLKMKRWFRFYLYMTLISLFLAMFGLKTAGGFYLTLKPELKTQDLSLKEKELKAKKNLDKLADIESLTATELRLTLEDLKKSGNLPPISSWVVLGEKVISDPIVNRNDGFLRESNFRSATEGLLSYPGSLEAMEGLIKLWAMLRESSAYKSKSMFYDVLQACFTALGQFDASATPDFIEKRKLVSEEVAKLQVSGQLVNAGNQLTKAGRYEEALSKYREAFNHEFVFNDDERSDAKRRVVRSLLLLGRYEEALVDWGWLGERIANKAVFDEEKSKIESLIYYKNSGDKSRVLAWIQTFKTNQRFEFLEGQPGNSLNMAKILFMSDAIGDNKMGEFLINEWIASYSKNVAKHSEAPLAVIETSEAAAKLAQAQKGSRKRAYEELEKYLRLREAYRSEYEKGKITMLLMAESEFYLL